MTKAQLDELLQLEPKLIDNSNFISVYLTKLAPSDAWTSLTTSRKRKSTSTASTSFPNGSLPPTTHSRRTQSITCSGYSAPGANGTVRFSWNTSRSPDGRLRQSEEVGGSLAQRPSNRSKPECRLPVFHRARQNNQRRTLGPVLLPEVFIKEQNYEPFVQLVRDDYLKPLFAEAKLTSGSGDPEKWYSMLSAGAVNSLRERIDLDFPHDNKEFFGANEPVRLKLAVKSVETLLVKAFEINTFNHYTRNLRPVDTTINLDGLSNLGTHRQVQGISHAQVGEEL